MDSLSQFLPKFWREYSAALTSLPIFRPEFVQELRLLHPSLMLDIVSGGRGEAAPPNSWIPLCGLSCLFIGVKGQFVLICPQSLPGLKGTSVSLGFFVPLCQGYRGTSPRCTPPPMLIYLHVSCSIPSLSYTSYLSEAIQDDFMLSI